MAHGRRPDGEGSGREEHLCSVRYRLVFRCRYDRHDGVGGTHGDREASILPREGDAHEITTVGNVDIRFVCVMAGRRDAHAIGADR